MIRKQVIRVLGAVASLSAVAAFAGVPLAAKPGAWEVTVKSATDGVLIPPAALAKMPAETRTRMLAAAKAKARAGKVNTHVSKSCVTAADLANDDQWGMNDDEDGDCKTTALSSTPTLRKFQVVCSGENPRQGTGTFTVSSPTQMTGVMDMSGPAGKIHVEMLGRWLGPTCSGDED